MKISLKKSRGSIRPLPDLYFLYGKGLAREGNNLEAAGYYLKAVRAFLDLDDLKSARQYLDSTRQEFRKANKTETAEVKKIKDLILIRDSVENCDPAVSGPEFSEANFLQILNGSDEESSFYRRQYFKIFTDLGYCMEERRQNPEIAYSRALLLIGQETALACNYDIDRLKRIHQDLVKKMKDPGGKQTFRIRIPKNISYGGADGMLRWVLNLQGNNQSLYVEMLPDFKTLASKNY